MSPYLRQVKTVSGATAVQVVAKDHGVRRIVEHLGSAHDEAELAALMRLGRQRLLAGQQVLDLGPALNDDADEVGGQAPGDGGAVRRPQIVSRRSGWPIEAIRSAYRRLGLGEAVGGDQAFEQMVAARLVEPTSKADTPRVLSEIGWPAPAHRNTLYASLARAQERGYRQAISGALFEHVTNTSGLALCLYDVTTLYFEAEREDDLRRVGYSKERRVDPQVIVGLLVDRAGFPLQVGCWEGNKAETTTIIPVVEAFQAAHGIEELNGGTIRTRFSTELDVAQACAGADLVIGAVLVPGARTPNLVTRAMVETMRPGSVLVDIAIDQGGCFEDSCPTTHSEPTFEVDGKIFYCVANMPGAVPHTSTYALTNATLPYTLALADEGWRGAIAARPDLARGLSTHAGTLYTAAVGQALDLPAADVADLLG
ncbi:IS1634 family transposase [Actinomyces viscosus]|uniref:Alanine dehydrogenase n=1 Tax=Actinomyces viscosus TaxID=1656 RepID=A0A3S4VAQ2_ACTVI|nr:IS1634 family transposase [Actinomyces viscosus]TFH53818.1 IS1634 family transposase [Actinomyces viscosus]VEI16226.1 Alanine dehydrogenase [Actinomyces viscosus]